MLADAILLSGIELPFQVPDIFPFTDKLLLMVISSVKEILYPYKPSSKNYKLWKKYYSGANGLFSVVIKSKKKSSVVKFVNSLELFGIGYSWGGFESLVLLQELRTNTKYTQTRQYLRFAKDEHIVRFHIGLEDPKDLIKDLKRSLRYIK